MELKELEEGKLAGTSPAVEEEEKQEAVQLNNTSTATPEEEENAGIVADTDTVAESEDINDEQQVESGTIDSELGIAEGSATKTFTQSQVDEIAGKIRKETREKVTRSFLDRYGVNSEDELDDLFGDAQRYTTVQDMYDADKKSWEEASAARDAELMSVKERVALLESGIDKNRYEDAKFILKGKGLEITVENIQQELATHPEWKTEQAPVEGPNPEFPFMKKPVAAQQEMVPQKPETPATTVDVLGNSGSDTPAPELSERERALKMFKV